MHTPIRISLQRGAAALIVTLLLFFAMVLGVVFVNRNLLFEHRASANQYRSTQAFEAAEAGLEWAIAELNTNTRIGIDCKPSTAAGAQPFRDRYLVARQGSYTPAMVAGAALRPSCVRAAGGWACSCPTQGLPSLAQPADDTPAPAFTLQFAAGTKPGTIRVTAIGCSRLGAPCLGGATGAADASARHEVLLGLMPGLRTLPAAALTARGNVDAGSGALGVHNADPATGLAIDAGGAITATQLRVTPPAGTSLAASLAAGDTALAARTPENLFATYFGIAPEPWKSQPVVARVVCADPCNDAISAAVGADGANRMLWVDGDLRLSGPLTLGSPSRPLIVAAGGTLELSGEVVIHGLVHAAAMTWNATAAHVALLRGAAIVAGDYGGSGSPDIVYDAAILATLRGESGSFARINGSWRDF
jgi:hypothetical protein